MAENVAAGVERNQRLIDALLLRRAQDERRCDLYQRAQYAHDAQRKRINEAAAALRKELYDALARVYALEADQKRTTTTAASSSPPPFNAVQQLQHSVAETQRFNESLEREIVLHEARVAALKAAKLNSEVRCGALQDRIDDMRRRGTATSDASAAAPREAFAAPSASAVTAAAAMIESSTQFYEEAFAAVRAAVVELVALQDALLWQLQRPSHPPGKGPVLTSDAFVLAYTQLRRREKEHYDDTVFHLSKLLE